MKYKSIIFIIFCSIFFAGKSNCAVGETNTVETRFSKQIAWCNNKKNNLEYSLDRFLDKKAVKAALKVSSIAAEVSAIAALTVLNCFAGQKIGETEVGIAIKKTILNSKKGMVSCILLATAILGAPGAGLVTGMIS